MHHKLANNKSNQTETSKANNDADTLYLKIWGLVSGIGVLLVVVIGMILTVPRVQADNNSSVDNLTIDLPVSCTLKSDIATGDDHYASVVSGEWRQGIGKTTITTFCNDANGFDIYAVGASDNTEGTTYLTSSVGSNYNIPTNVHHDGDTASSWAMKLDTVQGGQYNPIPVSGMFGNYIAVPSDWTKVAYRDANAGPMSMDENTGGSSFTTTYEVYVNSIQPAGTYTGAVKYVVLHPSVAQRPTLTTIEDALDNAVGTKTTYNGKQYYKMQDMTKAICDAVNVVGGGSQIQLLDDRTNLDGDKRLYWVAKLDDGNCWMTQNLDLDLIADHTYTHADTDLGWDPTSPNVNATWTVGSDYGTIPWDDINKKFTGWIDSYTLPSSGDPGEKYYYTSNTTSDDTTFDTMAQCIEAGHSQTDCEHYSAGNYYNWTAAIASNDSASITSNNAPNSICPAGWRLPNTSADEFASLMVEYNVIPNISSTSYTNSGFNNVRKAPLYFVRSGGIGANSIPASITQSGQYWSSKRTSGSYARNLGFNVNYLTPTGNTYGITRNNGASLRCLTR